MPAGIGQPLCIGYAYIKGLQYVNLRKIQPQLGSNRNRINLHLIIPQLLLKYWCPERVKHDTRSRQTVDTTLSASHPNSTNRVKKAKNKGVNKKPTSSK